MGRPEQDGKGIGSPDGTGSEWYWQNWCWWFLLIGFALRLAYCLTVDREASFGGWDGKEYFAYAQSLLAGRWDDYPRYFNSIRPPFYPIFLTPFLAVNERIVWHIQLVQSLLGISQAIILAKIAGRWAGQRAGNWAFGIALFHPFLIYYCAFVLTEAVFITLLWLGIACLQHWHRSAGSTERKVPALTLAAVSLALACLTRPALQPFLAVVALWICWVSCQKLGWMAACRQTAYFTAIASVLLLPFMIYNLKAHDEFTLAPGGARTMYALGNSPEYLRMYQARSKQEYYENFESLVGRFSVESSNKPETRVIGTDDFRREHPSDWWRLQAYKFKHFWTPWLNPLIFSRMNFVISLLTITPLFILAVVELWRRRRTPDPMLLLLLGLIGVGYVVGGLLFHVQVRYRFPFVDVSFIVLSASLLGSLRFLSWNALKRRA
jgi:hypothetical protein